QQTCGNPECQRLWHAKKCREWNLRNREYFQAIALSRKLEDCAGEKAEKPPLLPSDLQEVIGAQQVVIINYFAQQFVRRLQEVIRRQRSENTKDRRQVPRHPPARGDSRDAPGPAMVADHARRAHDGTPYDCTTGSGTA
ncbi:MAG: hypothetical protein PHI97_34455, partial [Desulfobulbus sp.]|nr:hypothetical protein [Desulfobulbus sp.]